MYESFYGLKELPFLVMPDPEFLYLNRRYANAYAMLKFGLEHKAGFIMISGEIGCGKTALIRLLLKNISQKVTLGLINHTSRDVSDLLEWILLSFGLPYENLSRADRLDNFLRFLYEQHELSKRVLLIIDEAHELSSEALESLRVLSKFNADKHQLFQVILVGQPELRGILSRPELGQFANLVELSCHLMPLDASEVEKYIYYRMMIAGREAPVFTTHACARIADASHGIPRRINILCHTALMYGFMEGAEQITPATVDKVLQDKQEYGALPPPEMN